MGKLTGPLPPPPMQCSGVTIGGLEGRGRPKNVNLFFGDSTNFILGGGHMSPPRNYATVKFFLGGAKATFWGGGLSPPSRGDAPAPPPPSKISSAATDSCKNSLTHTNSHTVKQGPGFEV